VSNVLVLLDFEKAFEPLDLQISLGVKDEKIIGENMARYV
jgi:hypothetical protein